MAELLSLTDFFKELDALVEAIKNRDDSQKEQLESLLINTETAIENLMHLRNEVSCKEILSELTDALRTLLQEINKSIVGHTRVRLSRLAIIDLQAKKVKNDGPGRPKYYIPEEVLLHFRDLGYCWKDIASMMCVSWWTISRRVSELGIKNLTGYSDVTDEELESSIKGFRSSTGKYLKSLQELIFMGTLVCHGFADFLDIYS